MKQLHFNNPEELMEYIRKLFVADLILDVQFYFLSGMCLDTSDYKELVYAIDAQPLKCVCITLINRKVEYFKVKPEFYRTDSYIDYLNKFLAERKGV